METTGITTPSGYKVTIKQSLTYSERRQVQKLFYSASNPKTGEIDNGVTIDATDLLLKLLVTQLTYPDGRTVVGGGSVFLVLDTLPDADIDAIYDEIDKLSNTITIFPTKDEKRGLSSSSSSNSTGTEKA